MRGRATDQEADVAVSEEGVQKLSQLGLEMILRLGDPELERCVLGLSLGVVNAGA